MRKQLTGTVVSTKTNKTATVRVDRSVQHPIYKKSYTISKKYYIHDEKNETNEGDKVLFEACAPISKLKRWTLVEITGKA